MEQRTKRGILIYIALALLTFLSLSIHAFPQTEQKFTLSGSVKDKETGKGIQASIVIYAQDRNAVEKFATKEDGSFSMVLRGGIEYRLGAYPWNNAYDMQYYENAATLSDAKSITLDKDYSDINFSLSKKPVYNNNISGLVKDKSGKSVLANVIVMSANNSQTQQYTINADYKNPGVFTLSNIVPGKYYLFAQPLNNSLYAGYYKENDVAVKSRNEATVIEVTEYGVVPTNYVITLDGTEAARTKYEIKGIITEEGEQPLEGVDISIMSGSGQEVVKGLKTDQVGSFMTFFEADYPDKYLLTAKKAGYKDAYYSFYLDEKNPAQHAFITMARTDDRIYNNGVKGLVRNSAGVGVMSKVTVIRIKEDGSPDYNKSGKTVETLKDNPGAFLLENIKPGNYVLYVSPAVNGLYPGYYKEGGVAVNDVMQATVISVSETGVNNDNYIVTLSDKAIDPNISYELYGYVTDEFSAPLSEVLITATMDDGTDVIANQENKTDKNGIFHLIFKSAGTFNLKAVKDGYINASGVMTFNDSMPVQKTMIIMYVKTAQNEGQVDSKILAGVNDDMTGIPVSVYPNPVRSELNISTGRAEGQIDVRIYSLNGQSVLSNTINSALGRATVNTESLVSGSYILRVYINGNAAETKVFVKE